MNNLEKEYRESWGKENPGCSVCGHTFCDYEVADNGEPICTECAEQAYVEYINLTPHNITLAGVNGENPFTIEPSHSPLGAEAIEVKVSTPERLLSRVLDVEFVSTSFVATPEGEAMLNAILEDKSNAVIIGSIIAAQAYPGKVCAMITCKGYERVSPAEKRMRKDKFTIF